jgi:hypothetical protein
MFFRGRPLSDESPISDYSNNFYFYFILKILELTENDVILYMLIEIPKEDENEISILTQNLEENPDLDTNISGGNPFNLNRGFNRFRVFGVEPAEIHLLRVLFHTAYLAQHRSDPSSVNWSANDVLRREEQWLNSNNPSVLNTANFLSGHSGAFRVLVGRSLRSGGGGGLAPHNLLLANRVSYFNYFNYFKII